MPSFYLQILFLVGFIFAIAGVSAPRPNYTPAAPGIERHGRDALIIGYFRQSYTNKEIVSLLASVHGIFISVRCLKMTLRRLNLRRRVQITDDGLQTALEAIENELKESGCSLGYRSMWRRLQKKGIRIPRDTVQKALLQLDPNGVERRYRRRLQRRNYVNPGPDFVWHVDGYDKLKPYGFAIHGAIDGFSRKVLWLRVGATNNNPKVVAKYYLQTILELQTVPCILRCDKGTENVHLRDIQVCFRSAQDDEFAGPASFQEGRSISNQRIEAWWAILRKQCANYWMNLFKDMISVGALNNADPIQIYSMRLCFMHLVQADLDRISEEWSTHRIAAKASSEGPRGKPDVLYFAPDSVDRQMYGVPCPVDMAESALDALNDNDAILPDHNPTFMQLVDELLGGWTEPNDVDSALVLYARIMDKIDRYA